MTLSNNRSVSIKQANRSCKNIDTPLRVNHVLILTATITPKSGYYNRKSGDPKLRLLDYKKAIDFYIKEQQNKVFSKIIIAENSNSDLSELQNLIEDNGVSDKVTIVRVDAAPYSESNVFYLELDLLVKLFNKLDKENISDMVFWKVTGRYIVKNIASIVSDFPESDVYVNCRNYPIRWADFYLVAFTHRAFERLLSSNIDAYNTLRSGEEIFRETLDMTKASDFKIVHRFKQVPYVSGARGRDRFNYGGIKGRFRLGIRIVARKLFPKLWI